MENGEAPAIAAGAIHPPYGWRVVVRTAALWLLLRTVLVVLAKTFVLVPAGSVIAVAATVTLVWLDGRRNHEHVFHANLGTPASLVVGISIATAATLELLTSVLARAAGLP